MIGCGGYAGVEDDDARAAATDDGWTIRDGIAEYWDAGDKPEFCVSLPRDFVLTSEIKNMLWEAYAEGRDAGEAWGRNSGRLEVQAQIRKALNL